MTPTAQLWGHCTEDTGRWAFLEPSVPSVPPAAFGAEAHMTRSSVALIGVAADGTSL